MRDFAAPSTVFWAANDTDPRGAVVSETLGNGVQTIRGFDAVTGLLDYIQSGLGGGSALQAASYQWDRVGNLTQRSEGTIGKTQDFVYDNLHRLDSWTLDGGSAIDITYDALGNITSRTFLGNYTYHATRKHIVMTAGVNSFSYDANGNVTAKNGSPMTWYSYNLPKLITKSGNNSSEFFYTPDRSRWKQVANYSGTGEQTIYIGGLMEKVTLGTVTSWKHYIAGGNGMVAEHIRRSSGTNETVYLLKDHLGSIEVITNSSGAQMARLAYGGLGGRRNGTGWNSVPSGSEWTTITDTTRRGYTGHEMLDNLNLVHMNGRIYDHDIGRFLSPDPFIQAPAVTQSFNRYSYVWNNPLSYTDPSGFQAMGPEDEPDEYIEPNFGALYGAPNDLWAMVDAAKWGMKNARLRMIRNRHPDWYRAPTQFANGRGSTLVAFPSREPPPAAPLPSESYDTVSTVGGTNDGSSWSAWNLLGISSANAADTFNGGSQTFRITNPIFSFPGVPPIRGLRLTNAVFEGHIKPRHAFDIGDEEAGHFNRGILNRTTSQEAFSRFLQVAINSGAVTFGPYERVPGGLRLFVEGTVPIGTTITGKPTSTLVIGVVPAGSPGVWSIQTTFPFGL